MINIHLPAILRFTRGTIGFDPSPNGIAAAQKRLTGTPVFLEGLDLKNEKHGHHVVEETTKYVCMYVWYIDIYVKLYYYYHYYYHYY